MQWIFCFRVLAAGNLICAVYTLIFLKLWSYVQVNYWCRTSRRTSIHSAAHINTVANRMKSMIDVQQSQPKREYLFRILGSLKNVLILYNKEPALVCFKF